MNKLFFGLFALCLLASIGCKKKSVDPPPPTDDPPTAPSLLAQVSATQTSVTINWFDASDDEQGFRIQQLINSSWTLFLNVSAQSGIGTYPAVTLDNLVPGAIYHIRVVAYNDAGVSGSSNEIDAQPTGLPLPPPPLNVNANALASELVRVSWIDPGNLDSFLVDRHGLSGSWSRVGAVDDNITIYNDATVSPGSTYFYRVGSKNSGGISWSTDSALVTTPNAGAPTAPDNLQAHVAVGEHVLLTWNDRSGNETGFTLQRGLVGEQLADIATIGVDITTYEDHPVDEGVYNYRVRAFNGLGVSAWAELLNIDYQNCSRGEIPICVGNYWEYLVHDTVGPDLNIHRAVARSEIYQNQVFYLFVQFPVGGGPVDTLYYLRNTSSGVQYVDHPLDGSPAILYRYPANSGNYSIAGEDCVLVASTSSRVEFADSVYTNCYDYQIFTRGTNTSKREIFIKPNTLGIVREIDRTGSNVTAIRDLTFVSLR